MHMCCPLAPPVLSVVCLVFTRIVLVQAEAPALVHTTWLLGWAATSFTAAALLAARAWTSRKR